MFAHIVLANLVIWLLVGAPKGEPDLGYSIEDIQSVLCGWSVNVNDNVLVKYKCFDVDEDGLQLEKSITVITHVLYEGKISVIESREGAFDWFRTWSDGAAIGWGVIGAGNQRMYTLKRHLLPGDKARLGFIFSGFAGMDSPIPLAATDYPSRGDRILSVSHEYDEVTVRIGLAGFSDELLYHVVVFGVLDNQVRRFEVWKELETGPKQIIRTEYLNWKTINGQLRPNTLFVSRSALINDKQISGKKYEIIEIRTSVESDLELIPQNRKGDSISDERIKLIGWIGSNFFSLSGFVYRSNIPISGPPLNLNALLSEFHFYSADVESPDSRQHTSGLREWSGTTKLGVASLAFVLVTCITWFILRRATIS